MVGFRGQLKIQQMAFMLMAVTLFFVFVGMFLIVIQMSNIQSSAESLDERNALLLVMRLANSPEFSCGESFGVQKSNCVDFHKVMALKENIDRYGNFWGVSNIQIRKIYPASDTECTAETYPDCGILKLRDGDVGGQYDNFISLCRKEGIDGDIQDKCEIAKLMVAYGE